MKSYKVPALVAALVGSVGVPAMAAAVDVSAVTADISAQLGPVGLIGAGILILTVGIKAFKWIQKAMG